MKQTVIVTCSEEQWLWSTGSGWQWSTPGHTPAPGNTSLLHLLQSASPVDTGCPQLSCCHLQHLPHSSPCLQTAWIVSWSVSCRSWDRNEPTGLRATAGEPGWWSVSWWADLSTACTARLTCFKYQRKAGHDALYQPSCTYSSGSWKILICAPVITTSAHTTDQSSSHHRDGEQQSMTKGCLNSLFYNLSPQKINLT